MSVSQTTTSQLFDAGTQLFDAAAPRRGIEEREG